MVERTVGNGHHWGAVYLVRDDEVIVGRRRKALVEACDRQLVIAVAGVGQRNKVLIGYGQRWIIGIAIGGAIHTFALIVGQYWQRIDTNLLTPDKVFTPCLQIEGCATVGQFWFSSLHTLSLTQHCLVETVGDDTSTQSVTHKSGAITSTQTIGISSKQKRIEDISLTTTAHDKEASSPCLVAASSERTVIDAVADGQLAVTKCVIDNTCNASIAIGYFQIH